MPSITSSSNGASKCKLFASERTALLKSQQTGIWLQRYADDEQLKNYATVVTGAIVNLLKLLPTDEKPAPKPQQPP